MASIKTLERARAFYLWELERKGLTKDMRPAIKKALKIVEGSIKEKEKQRVIYHTNRMIRRGY